MLDAASERGILNQTPVTPKNTGKTISIGIRKISWRVSERKIAL